MNVTKDRMKDFYNMYEKAFSKKVIKDSNGNVYYYEKDDVQCDYWDSYEADYYRSSYRKADDSIDIETKIDREKRYLEDLRYKVDKEAMNLKLFSALVARMRENIQEEVLRKQIQEQVEIAKADLERLNKLIAEARSAPEFFTVCGNNRKIELEL